MAESLWFSFLKFGFDRPFIPKQPKTEAESEKPKRKPSSKAAKAKAKGKAKAEKASPAASKRPKK